MLIGTVAAYDIPGTLVVSILVAADISSAGVGIPQMRTATTPFRTGNYITRAYWYIKVEYAAQQHQVYAILERGRTWYSYVLEYLVGCGPTAVCTVFFFDGRFDAPGAMPRCSVRNTYCMLHICGFAEIPVR